MKNWIEAFRLRTLMLSLACILMGFFLAKRSHVDIDILSIIFTFLTAFLASSYQNLKEERSNLEGEIEDFFNIFSYKA